MQENKTSNESGAHRPASNSPPWDYVIRPEVGWVNFGVGDLWRCRDLIRLLTRRNIVGFYKQTVLGPIWHLLQPLASAAAMLFVFSSIAGIPTEGMPPLLFFLCGVSLWSLFAECLTASAGTLRENANLFGKVYFPRLAAPFASALTALFKFCMHSTITFSVAAYYYVSRPDMIHLTPYLAALPLIALWAALLGSGFGLIAAALSVRYRDLAFAMGTIVQFWMYATPVVYPLNAAPQFFQRASDFNPAAAMVELMRACIRGSDFPEPYRVLISLAILAVVLIVGSALFERAQRSFVDIA
jgi:lipopolysaccharide transport system permease protein